MRSPTASPAASAPNAATLPTISWPGMSGSFEFGSSPSTTCRSVRQTPQAATSSNISRAAGTGVGRSRMRSGARAVSSTMACMRAPPCYGPEASLAETAVLVGGDARCPEHLAEALGIRSDQRIEFLRCVDDRHHPLAFQALLHLGGPQDR